MLRGSVLLAVVWGSVGFLAGCGSAEMADLSGVDIAELSKVPGPKVYHEFKKIYSVEVHGKTAVRTHVGYLDRQFSEEDREGKYFVKDLKHDVVGFLLPGGKAFSYEPRRADAAAYARDLANTGFDNGVKRILEVPGEIQYGALEEGSSAPPPANP